MAVRRSGLIEIGWIIIIRAIFIPTPRRQDAKKDKLAWRLCVLARGNHSPGLDISHFLDGAPGLGHADVDTIARFRYIYYYQ